MSVPAGRCAVPIVSDGSVALCRWDAAEVVALNAGPGAGTSRIDLVVVTVRDAAISGANNDFIVQVLTGQAAAAPVPPNLVANSYALCQVLVPATAANLNAATITDLRASLTAPRSVEYNLAADTDVTATAFSTVLSGTFAPSGSRVRADLSCTGFIAAAASPRTQFQITNGVGQTKLVSAPASNANPNGATFAGGSALFTGLTPGQLYTFAVQVAVSSGTTWRMRCGSQPLLEMCRLNLTDA